MKRPRLIILMGTLAVLVSLCLKLLAQPPNSTLLSEPFLQLPDTNSVNVVWFTEFPGVEHRVIYGDDLKRTVKASTMLMSRFREDADSNLGNNTPQQITERSIWRHEALIEDLSPGKRVPYRAISVEERDGQRTEISSQVYRLSPLPQPGTPVKILLTSDYQLKPMVAANLQKVVETIGQPDAVFLAGDLIDVPDRASEWFDDARGGAFFPCLQGRARYELTKNETKTIYRGGEIIQYAPLFTAIGNHEVMGRFSRERSLKQQLSDAYPRQAARKYYEENAAEINPTGDPDLKEDWLKNHSFNSDTYEEIFTFPENNSGGERYYAVTFGEVRLVVLDATNIWRSPRRAPEVKGRYQEREADVNEPWNWGFGQHIFEPIAKGSPQYNWLERELASEEFQRAQYKVLMLHNPLHTLGENIVPPFTDPVPQIEYRPDGTIQSVGYEYPKEEDYFVGDLIPLIESAGVQLVFYGHSHLWNRFTSDRNVHYLETSNVGNSYGAYLGEKRRSVPPQNPDYAATGNPNGLEPILPTLDPLRGENGEPLPYVASNDITVFSILDTADGTVTSYRFDTRKPDSPAIAFDRFSL